MASLFKVALSAIVKLSLYSFSKHRVQGLLKLVRRKEERDGRDHDELHAFDGILSKGGFVEVKGEGDGHSSH